MVGVGVVESTLPLCGNTRTPVQGWIVIETNARSWSEERGPVGIRRPVKCIKTIGVPRAMENEFSVVGVIEAHAPTKYQ